LGLAAHAFATLAVLARRTVAAGAAAAVVAALLARTLGLATADALAVLATLVRPALAASPGAAVAAALLARTVRDASLARAASFAFNFAHTNIVPCGFAAERVQFANARLDVGIVTAGRVVGLAARPHLGALAAIFGAVGASLSADAVAVSAGRTAFAVTTAQGIHLIDADSIPFHIAAEHVLGADALLHARVFAAR